MDVVLVGFIAGFTFGGFRTGLVRRAAGLAFMALAFVLGAYLRAPFGALIAGLFKDIPEAYGELVAYTILFPVIVAVAHILAGPLLKRVEVGGLTTDVDKVLGAVFGFVEAVLLVSAAVVIFDTYALAASNLPQGAGLGFLKSLRDGVEGSTTVHILRNTTVPFVLTILGPLLPQDLTALIPGGVPSLPGVPGIPGLPTPKPTASPTRR
jgi:uncharacterized membrane protein required for colicin V production